MSPFEASSSLRSSRMKVDLPEPDCPTMKTNSPFSTSTETSSSATVPFRYVFETCWRLIMAWFPGEEVAGLRPRASLTATSGEGNERGRLDSLAAPDGDRHPTTAANACARRPAGGRPAPGVPRGDRRARADRRVRAARPARVRLPPALVERPPGHPVV